MAIEGPLKELGLHDIFQLLDLSRKTGVMRVTSHLRNNEGLVAFDGGAIVHAEIRSNPHRIGDMLVNAGRITAADLERARAVQEKEPGRRLLGQILVGLGVLTERELQRVVESHIAEVVLELLSWQEGFFSFTEGPLTIAMNTAVRIRTESLLMEGARRIDEWSRIEAHIPHLGVVPVLAPLSEGDVPAQLDLLPGEWEVLAHVDGVRDVRQIAEGLGRSEFEVARVLFGMMTTGVCVLHDAGAGRAARPSSGDDATALVATAELRLEAGDVTAAREAALAAAAAVRPGEPRVHLVLARANLREGRLPDAIDEARRAVRLSPEHFEAHRLFGVTLAAAGRFREADEQWAQCERLANGDVASGVRGQVSAAREAAQTLESMLEAARG